MRMSCIKLFFRSIKLSKKQRTKIGTKRRKMRSEKTRLHRSLHRKPQRAEYALTDSNSTVSESDDFYCRIVKTENFEMYYSYKARGGFLPFAIHASNIQSAARISRLRTVFSGSRDQAPDTERVLKATPERASFLPPQPPDQARFFLLPAFRLLLVPVSFLSKQSR